MELIDTERKLDGLERQGVVLRSRDVDMARADEMENDALLLSLR